MTDISSEDRRWLDAAARYASAFLGTTGDSPTVGALLVSPHTQTVLARAVTAKGGRPHAAAQAISLAGFDAAGCTLYLTLEPCHHWGRTPPCVDAIIRSGIMRVVIGVADPDARAAGGSVTQLESAGIEAVIVNHAPSLALHAGHIMRQTAGRPFVTAVLAVSTDGKIGPNGLSRGGIAGDIAHDWIEVARARSDAILIGGATARLDDPKLTVTLPGLTAHTPLRVILAGADGLDKNVNLIGGFSGYRTAIIAESSAKIDAPVSVETIRLAGPDGRPTVKGALAALGQKGIQNLLVRPGQRLAASLLEADLVDRFALIVSPDSIGPSGRAASQLGAIAEVLLAAGLEQVDSRPLGRDTLALYERPTPSSQS